ncbi:MAG: heme-binding protein [Acidobacteria bacterium]|nr:heme-binding protein [Acidobacteriota bacterium]
MTRRFVGLMLFAAAAFASPLTFAQGQAPVQGPAGGMGRQGGAGGPGGGGGRGGAPAQVDFATAKKAMDATEAAANAANAKVAIAVVDANGDLVYFRRMDGAASVAVTASQAKARAAILFGVPTKALQDAVAAGTPVSATVTPAAATGAPIMAVQGGLPIVKAGKVVGAIGVGGSSSQNDELFAQAGIDAVK